MKYPKAVILIITLIWLVGLVSSAHATVLYMTDTTLLGVDSPIYYTLDYSATGGTGSATLTINTPSLPGIEPWYIGWIIFKFDGSNPWTITNPPLSSWAVADATTQVLASSGKKGPTFKSLFSANSGFTGIYLANLDNSNLIDQDPSLGIRMTDGSPTSFTFGIASTGVGLNLTSIPFQVGYYDPPAGQPVVTSQLSGNFTPVPEPGTLLLLGSGLVGVAAVGRRLRKRG